MFQNFSFSILFLILSSQSFATEFDNGIYKVTCKAKYELKNSAGESLKKEVKDFEKTSEDKDYVFWDTEVGGFKYQIQENKKVYFFRPVLTTDTGEKIKTTGYFDATGSISLYYSKDLKDNKQLLTDIRCCKGCKYSDWDK